MSVCRLALPESIGHGNAESLLLQMQQQLQRQLSAGNVDCVEVDAAALQQFDSSALTVLLALLRVAQQQRCQWAVVSPSKRLARLATLYGLDALLLSRSVDAVPA